MQGFSIFNFAKFFFHAGALPSPQLFAERIGPTSVHAFWVLPSPASEERGFRITYKGGSSGIVDIEDAFATSTVITGLNNGANYTMFISTTSILPSVLPSMLTESNIVQLGMCSIQMLCHVITHT